MELKFLSLCGMMLIFGILSCNAELVGKFYAERKKERKEERKKERKKDRRKERKKERKKEGERNEGKDEWRKGNTIEFNG